MIERLQIPDTPKPSGPYSSAVRAGDFLYISGQGPIDPATGELQASATIKEQTRLVLKNLQTILLGCGADLENVVKCSVFLLDANDFGAMNAVYAEVFGQNKPARTTVATGMVAAGMKIEIDCVAYVPQLAPSSV